MGYVSDMSRVESAPNWLLNRLCNESNENIIKIATVLWGVWFARNKRVWDHKRLTPAITVELSKNQISEWQQAMQMKQVGESGSPTTGVSSDTHWEAPNPGWCKPNVDASVFSGAESFSVGMVLRDEHGMFVTGKNMRVAGQIGVMEAEAVGVLEALSWIYEQGWQHVILESDSLQVVSALHHNIEYQLEVGNILDMCRAILRQMNSVIVCHVKKQANRVAHLLARFPCLVDSSNCFMSPPSMLVEALSLDNLVD